MTSVERVVEYAELESEAPWEMDKRPPGDWPQTGSIVFDRVNFSYSAKEPLVLKNLSVVFSSREKVLVFIPTCVRLVKCTACDLICTQCRRCGVILFHVALFPNQLLKGQHIVLLNLEDYSICDSWNTYHVIKTIQVDPFVSNLHFELPDSDNCLFSIREMGDRERGRERERGGQRRRK